MTTFILIAVVVIIALFVARMIINHRAEQDERARLNYERHQYERARKLTNDQLSDTQRRETQRAGHRRAGEYSWGREGEGA